MAAVYNVTGQVKDGSTFTGGGLDRGGRTYSANLLAARPARGISFTLGPANALSAATSVQIPLPVGQFSAVKLLAAAVNGNQKAQTFTVTYADGTTSLFTQSLSDWCTPQSYLGESKAITMPYRNNSDGTRDIRETDLYSYSFDLANGKAPIVLTLPQNPNVIVMAIDLEAGAPPRRPVPVSLTTAFNTTGIQTDGRAFAGGLDGIGGYAYSANLLGMAHTFNGAVLVLGPAGARDVISGTGKSIALPAGKFSTLLMLATGVYGSQVAQTFKVTYSDGTSSAFTRSLSDWVAPQNFPGESLAVAMAYRVSANGTRDNRPFNLYAYSFALESGRIVSSIVMPSNPNVKVLALTLVP